MTAVIPEKILADDTSMSAVSIRVANLEGMAGYYSSAFAMEALEERSRDGEVHRVLGRGTVPLIRLVHTPGLPPNDPRQAGLFHTAFLFNDPASLAATVHRAAQTRGGRFAGASDHLVSEAFYFADPEGNGVELYTDRDRTLWVRDGPEIRMATEHLDPNTYLQQHLQQDAIDAGASLPGIVGHVHLQVGDLATARAFYLDALGFEATQTGYRGALFASAGGYHHHIAMNVWNSRGAGPRAASLGLGDVAITIPQPPGLDALAERLTHHGVPFSHDGRAIAVKDPWGTRVTLSLPGITTDELMSR